MADRSVPVSPSPTEGTPTRRSVLGAGLAVASAAVGAETALVPSAVAAPARRRIAFGRWRGTQFSTGTHAGTAVVSAGLVLRGNAESRVYTDPRGVTRTYDTATWTSPMSWSTFSLTELVASWNAVTPNGTWIEVSVGGLTTTGAASGWFKAAYWASTDPADGGVIYRGSGTPQANAVARMDVDILKTLPGVALSGWVIKVTLLRPRGTTLTPTVNLLGAMTSSLPGATPVAVSPVGVGRGVTLNVPPLSQEVHRGHYPQWAGGGEAWCSATSTAMVLAYWGTGPTAADLAWVQPWVDSQVDYAARHVYDNSYRGCGNWPFNTAYAARFGLEAFVVRLRTLTEAEQFIKAGIPLIVSVSFSKAELPAAGYSTAGHLLVICGFTATGDVVCNDPASHLVASNARVRVIYPRAQFENVWIPKSGGTAYVIRRTTTPLPTPPADANWPTS